MRFVDGQHIHLVGIGGFGISAIARILLERGFKVSGSDLTSNDLTDALARDGATIYHGHDSAYINGADMLIVTSAASPDHVEVKAAKEQNIPVYKRNDIIADLMEGQHVIAVAGTHGKTTTTSMIVHILRECGADPSYIVGGIMGNTGTNAGVGQGTLFVIEADEYDNMFLGLKPDVAIITSVEYDHPDFFESEAALIGSFEQFIARLNDGLLVVADDNSQLVQWMMARQNAGHPAMKYGFKPDSDCRASNFHIKDGLSHFKIHLGQKTPPIEVALGVPGKHNMMNALGATLVAQGLCGMPFHADGALRSFKNSGRRFDVRGDAGGVIIVDDYAHHPTAIKTTIEAAKLRYPQYKIWAVWQPHTFSRTETLLEGYAIAFGDADAVVVTDIYASREKPTANSITGERTSQAIRHDVVHYTGSIAATTDFLEQYVVSPAVILIMSAGDAPQIGKDYLHRMKERAR